jgi:hypothetical protein
MVLGNFVLTYTSAAISTEPNIAIAVGKKVFSQRLVNWMLVFDEY